MGLSIGSKILDNAYKYGTIGYAMVKCMTMTGFISKYKGSDKAFLSRRHKQVFGKEMDFDNPQTLNEKMKWLMVNDRRRIHTLLADKYTMRSYIKEHFGEDYLVPLVYETTNWRDITLDVIPDYPCIVKATHSSHQNIIIKDKSKVDIRKLRFSCRCWLGFNMYAHTREWQYKNSTRRIIIEKLLNTKEGYIPNDYKLHFINGELAFVYCSVGRETVNKRNIYDANWKPLYFTWVEKEKDPTTVRGEEIPAPASFDKMKEIGKEIAKMFDYVRVDFYDVDGTLYCGEVTFHHGSGNDVFTPEEYDLKYGKMLRFEKARIE